MILTIVLGVLAAWLLVSMLLAIVIGRAIRLADRDHSRRIAHRTTTTAAARPLARAS